MSDQQAIERPDAPAHAGVFQALYHADLLELVNPTGDVGLITLWSPRRSVRRRLEAISPRILDPRASRVAVVSNLYGDGMYAMFCNLLFNPQIRHLVALGEDLGLSTGAEIEAFLARGTEEAQLLGMPVRRIRGTARMLPAASEFDEPRLRAQVGFHRLGKLSSPALADQLVSLLEELPRAPAAPRRGRLRVELPDPAPAERAGRPSQVGTHQVARRTPLACWEELVVRAVRFGAPVALRKGARLELLDARAVIAEPRRDPERALAGYGFALAELAGYESDVLEAELPQDIDYTYGNRLRGHFVRAGAPLDTLDAAIAALRADPESRRAFISLWDNAADLPGAPAPDTGGPAPDDAAADVEEERSAPCLVSLFFRRSAGRLALSATYRSHNLLTAWLKNVYGLMAIQRHIAQAAGMQPGPLTVLSHSLCIDPGSPRYELARALARDWTLDRERDHDTGKRDLREDPRGYFTVTADRGRGVIVAEHRFQGVVLERYEDASARRLAGRIAGQQAVGLVSHALWLGQELARAEARLHAGEPAARLTAERLP
ncbi:MAG TPA: thymidylate synthase [Solirubrobacteraceae bacterium]|nr:thymidylate synthase [Solirubrobacteraceae bacterium]